MVQFTRKLTAAPGVSAYTIDPFAVTHVVFAYVLLQWCSCASHLSLSDTHMNPWRHRYGSTNLLAYHLQRGSVEVTLGKGCAGTVKAAGSAAALARAFHGLVMFSGWSTITTLGTLRLLLLLPLCSLQSVSHGVATAGVIVARYCRHRHWWIKTHITLQSVGTAGTLSAAAVAVTSSQVHAAHLHALLGIVVAVLTGELVVLAPAALPRDPPNLTPTTW